LGSVIDMKCVCDIVQTKYMARSTSVVLKLSIHIDH
jgi:hypothetical protein